MISLVIWSPHSLMIGMLTSSINTVIFLPAGGPYVVPGRASRVKSENEVIRNGARPEPVGRLENEVIRNGPEPVGRLENEGRL